MHSKPLIHPIVWCLISVSATGSVLTWQNLGYPDMQGRSFCLAACTVVAPSTSYSVQPTGRFGLVEPRMQQFVDKSEPASIVTLVASNDNVLYTAVGKNGLAGNRRLRTNDIFWIASMTKPLTAVCTAILADAGSSRSTSRSRSISPSLQA
jgi:hypothetical protein